MPFNGSGVYIPLSPPDFPAIPATKIRSSQYNNQIQDLATALSNCITRDGQSSLLDDIPMGGYQLESLGVPSNSGEALRYDQIQKGSDVASASTLALPVEGAFFEITGTTDIFLLSSGVPGRSFYLKFQDELVLHHSANLKLPGEGDYTTTAGEIIEFIHTSPGVWELFSGGGGGSSGIGGPGRRLIITSNQNVTLPASKIWITACGRGGNGAPAAGTGDCGAGGGGGAVFVRREFQVTKGAVVAASVSSSASLAGIFTLASGQNASGSTPGSGGAASSEGTGGISAKGGTGSGRGIGSNGCGGSGGGSLGGGGAGGGSSDNTRSSLPGIVSYGTAPTNGRSMGGLFAGGDGIGVGFAGPGAWSSPFSASAGKGGFGAGGGGQGGATSGSGGQGGDAVIMIEW